MIATTLHVLRQLLYGALILVFLIAIAVVALRLWWPNLPAHKSKIEDYLSAQIGRPVLIQRLHARWDGWSPSFKTGGLRVRRKLGDHSSLRLGGIEVQVSPWSLILGDLIFERFIVNAPTLEITWKQGGGVRIGDMTAEKSSSDEDLAYLQWLLRQRDLTLRNGTVIWRDERNPSEFLEFSSIEMRFVNDGGRHEFRGTARCPEAVCSVIEISAELTGEPLRSHWEGGIEVHFDSVNLGNAPTAISELIPNLDRGLLDARVTTTWRAGKLAEAHARTALKDVELFLHKGGPLRRIDVLSADVNWRWQEDGWSMAVRDPLLTAQGVELSLEDIELRKSGERTTLRLGHLDMQTLARAISAFSDAFSDDLDAIRQLRAANPRGDLHDIEFGFNGPLARPEGWKLEAEFAQLTTEPVGGWPGLRGIEGKLSAERASGRVRLRGVGAAMHFPRWFAAPIVFPTMRANAAWSRSGEGWTIELEQIQARNDDVELTNGGGRVEISASGVGLDLSAEVPRADISRVPSYLPFNTPAKTVRWLNRALVSGRAADGKIRWRGPAGRSAFSGGEGEFVASFKVQDAVFDYADDWPLISDLQADITFHNAGLRVSAAKGQVMGSRIRGVSGHGENLYQRQRLLKLTAMLDAKVSDVVDFLRRGPLVKKSGNDAMEIAGFGDGELELNLTLPLSELRTSRVDGMFRTQGGALQWPNGVAVESIRGALRFTEKSITGEGIGARLLGGAVTLDVLTLQPRTPPVFAIDAHGEVDAERLKPILGSRLVAPMGGGSAWSGRLTVDRDTAELEVASELVGITLNLPPPLAKSAGTPLSFTAAVGYANTGARRVAFQAGAELRGNLAFHSSDGTRGWRFQRGHLVLGEGRPLLPSDEELWFAANTNTLDLDAWLDELLRGGTDTESDAAPRLIDALRRVHLDVHSLTFFQRDFGHVAMQARSPDGFNWSAELAGELVRGKARARIDEPPHRYDLELDRLYWPRAATAAAAASKREYNNLPTMRVSARAFRFGNLSLGKLRFEAEPRTDGWRISTVRSEQPGLSLQGDGWWRHSRGPQRTEIAFSATSSDIGLALTALALPDQVAGGEGTLQVNASWDGGPGAFEFNKLDGKFAFSANRGRFLQVDPGGGGRLFGLLNVEALIRRLTLDFSDVFSKGLAFDRIDAQGALQQGDLLSDGFFVIGPAALIEASGRVGLAKEDYDLEIMVAPQVGANLSLLSAIANPAAGAVVFVVQKLLKKQIAKLVRYHYLVTGSWESPDIHRVKQEPEDVESNAAQN